MKIQGAGGGGGGGKGQQPEQRTPVEAPDSLRSASYAHVIDLVSEGEIEGLVDGLKSVFLNETPIQNEDGTFNFTGVTLTTREGTQSQNYIPGTSGAENEVNVGVEVKATTPVVRTINNSNVDAVRLLISMPQLTYQNVSNGDLLGTHVEYAIDVQSNGGGFVQKVLDTVSGKSTSRYERSYRIRLEGGAPYDIRVRRLTPDATSSTVQNRTLWSSYTLIEETKLRYPNSALMALRVASQQFSSIPTRAYDLKLLRIRVPTNYDPETRAYDGVWDGSFKIAWTDNPAWIFYDLVTSERYGLGGHIPESHVDKWTLYSVGRYCDELVPDGFGGEEPRFVCNIYLQSRAEAYKVINDLASIFRGMVYWANGALTVSQDSPQDPSYLFTPANVVDGRFTYAGASAKTRHTVALVTWNDPTDFYRAKVEYVEDQQAMVRYGVIETQVVAVGCVSRGQAHRLGRWLLYTERFQTETVTFQTGLEGAVLRPGQVIQVADPVRAGKRTGGRVSEATVDTVTVDAEVSVDAPLTLSVMLPDGTVEERGIVGVTGRAIEVSPAFSQAPQKGSVWLVSALAVEAQTFRVVSIAEASGGVFEVMALAHDNDKFDHVDLGTLLEEKPISTLTVPPDAPAGITVTETLYTVGRDIRVKVTVSWPPARGAVGYVVQYRRDNQNMVAMPETASNDVEILGAEPGEYEFFVTSLSAIGKRSTPAYTTKTIRGRGNPPAQVQNFSLVPNAGMAYLSWDEAADLDVLIGGSVRIRHTPNTDNPLWKNSVDVSPALAGTATRAVVPLLAGCYLAKFVDATGNASNEESLIVTTIPEAQALNVVATMEEHLGWEGQKNGTEYSEELGGLVISSSLAVDSMLDVDLVNNWDFAGGVSPEAEYYFADALDLGEVYTSRVTATIAAHAVDLADLVDLRMDLLDEWLDLDSEYLDDVNAALYMRTTEEDPADPLAEWTEWKLFFVSEYKARGLEFFLKMTSGNEAHTLAVSEASIQVDVPDRAIDMAGLVSGAGTYAVNFEAPFYAPPAVGIAAHNMNQGDFYQIANKTNTGFDIVFKDQAGLPVSRVFDVLAKGYGRAVLT